MSGVITAGVIGTYLVGSTIYQGDQQRRQQNQAQDAALENARKQEATATAAAKKQEEDFNRANRNAPDVTALLRSGQDIAKSGVGGTLLTGTGGGTQSVSKGDITLSKNSLLG